MRLPSSLARRAITTLLLVSSASLSQLTSAQTFMVFNVEWFWDELEPHEGNVVDGFDIFPFPEAFVELKAYAIADLVQDADTDVVGLVEVENEAAAKRILKYLPGEWSIVFEKGRDTYTGQDVAVLTKLPVRQGSITTFEDITGHYRGTTKTPSKVLGVGLEYGDSSIYVINAHLLSKRQNSLSKDRKRAAQANALYQAVQQNANEYEHVVVLGDLNDTLGSQPLKEVRGIGDASGGIKLVQTDPGDGSVVSIKEYGEVIDHILISESLAETCSSLKQVDSGPVSDHNAMVVVCE